MELFSEIYSCYYQVVSEILRRASKAPLTVRQMTEIVDSKAFAESGLYLLPKLTSGEWELLTQAEDGFHAKVHHMMNPPLSTLQRAWLKAILQDPKIRLFLTDLQLCELTKALAEVPALFSIGDFYDFDTYTDGDPYDDPIYRARFMQILDALCKRQILTITFHSPKRGDCCGDYLPCELEYSRKDNKFRLYAAKISGGKSTGIFVINLGRITGIMPSREKYEGIIDLDAYFRHNRCAQPVCMRIFNERNAVERCMLHFASYEKRTEYDRITDTYTCFIYYDRNDETELLIRILSFGPVVQVLGPEPFLKQVKERVRKQHEMMR